MEECKENNHFSSSLQPGQADMVANADLVKGPLSALPRSEYSSKWEQVGSWCAKTLSVTHSTHSANQNLEFGSVFDRKCSLCYNKSRH